MAGVTSTIDVSVLKVQWDSHSSMAAICTYWTITKDQLIRLRDFHGLPARQDRRLRWKPKRSDYVDPTAEQIAERCKAIRLSWDDATERMRRVTKQETAADIVIVTLQPDQRHYFDELNQDGMF